VRTLIVTEFISLDGVVEAPGGEATHPNAGWTMTYGVPESYAFKLKETMDAQSLLLGRITYEGFAAAWPGRKGDPFADKMNSMPKHVVTNTLTELEWNATPLRGDIIAGITELKQGDGGPILVHGSATLVRFLLAEHLVDELHLMVFPVAIGGGLRMFSDDRKKLEFELTDLVRAPWHDREVSAEALPYGDASLGAIVLFDVLHHLPSPRRFFAEAVRVLRPGARLVMCEPYVSPVSYPVYKLFHDEPLALRVDPLADQTGTDARDPFDSNQAIPTLLFGRARAVFEREFPTLAIRDVEYFAGLSYPASGGFSRRPILPMPVWSVLHGLEARLPAAVLRRTAFRILVAIERTL